MDDDKNKAIRAPFELNSTEVIPGQQTNPAKIAEDRWPSG